jgi:hypothetical protein
MNQIRISTKEDIEKLVETSAPTFEGLAESSFDEMASIFEKEFGFNKSKVYILSGKDMNEAYGLTGDNAYPDDLNIVSLDWKDLTNKPNYIKMRGYGIRWMDDIVDNNVRRERERA